MFLDKLGGRKFVLVFLAVTLAFVLALLNKLTDAFASIAVAGVASFAGANAYITGKTKDAPAAQE